jgi:CheY-like chemotaxis protein
MSEQVQAHLFEPFYTTKGDNKGIGLGLATVYGIVQQNRGFIEVVSAPNQGTTFKIYLPRAESKPESLLPSERVSAKCEKCTVLVVEDEPAILSLIRRQLSTHGYAVLTAQSPTEAIRVVKEHLSQVHLLLTDVIMPQLNGKDLAEAIAQISPGIRCLFMSGYTADIIAKHGVVDSEMAFIQKPFTTAQLIEQVARVLGRDLAQGERSTPNRLELLAPTEKTQ